MDADALLRQYAFLDSPEAEIFWTHFRQCSPENRIFALRKEYAADLICAAESLYQLRLRAHKKGFTHPRLWWTEKSLQQASSAWTAKYHAHLAQEAKIVADICCGAGSELSFFCRQANRVYAVDNDYYTLQLAQHNAEVQRLKNVTFLRQNAQDFSHAVDFLFVDPDRRSDTKRWGDPALYSPPLNEWKKFLVKSRNFCVKISPLADFQPIAAMLDAEIHFVSVENEMKEILLVAGEKAQPNKRVAIDAEQGIEFSAQMKAPIHTTECQHFLLEPNVALVTSGLLGAYASMHGYAFLDNQSPYLVAKTYNPDGWCKAYRIDDSFAFHEKTFKKDLEKRNIGQAVFKKKGFAVPIVQYEKMKLHGALSATVFFTPIAGKRKIILCNIQER